MKKKSKLVPKAMKPFYDEITQIIRAFCKENLNEEYEELCCQLCAALCRKRPSPLVKGKSKSWACGIVHAIGMANFLFDPSQEPHMKASELYEKFGVSSSTGLSKSKQIRDIMKISQFDVNWILPSKMEDNPFIWMISVNGLAIDVRYAPREIQEEAFRKGLIPYIPDDRRNGTGSKILQFDRKESGKKVDRKEREEQLHQAQELVYKAWETESRKKRVSLARKAIEISADCADAYVILAQETAKDLFETRDLYEKAVKAGENAIGPRKFKEYTGNFWGYIETRPYMRARWGLAEILWVMRERKQAIEHCKDMLRLNPNDNQGIRHILISWLIEAGENKDVERLFEQYEGDCFASWVYSQALYLFRKGSKVEACIKLKEAIERNHYVPLYILGYKKMPKEMPDYFSLGDETEAIAYVWDSYNLWHSVDGACEWLKENLPGRIGG